MWYKIKKISKKIVIFENMEYKESVHIAENFNQYFGNSIKDIRTIKEFNQFYITGTQLVIRC